MFDLDALAAKLRPLGADHGVVSPGVIDRPRAAVAAILRDRPGASSADIFFIRRAEHPRDPWSGHIAFPGGRRELADASLLATAIRETREEVGIDLARGELLGRLPDLEASQSKHGGLVVTPFVFAMRDDLVLAPNNEVAETMWISFARLAQGEARSTHAFEWGGSSYEFPCVRLDLLTGATLAPASLAAGTSAPGTGVVSVEAGVVPVARPSVLWGMTYRMLETMLEAVGHTLPLASAMLPLGGAAFPRDDD